MFAGTSGGSRLSLALGGDKGGQSFNRGWGQLCFWNIGQDGEYPMCVFEAVMLTVIKECLKVFPYLLKGQRMSHLVKA